MMTDRLDDLRTPSTFAQCLSDFKNQKRVFMYAEEDIKKKSLQKLEGKKITEEMQTRNDTREEPYTTTLTPTAPAVQITRGTLHSNVHTAL